MVTEEELAALRSEHGSVCVVRGRKKEALLVLRPITKTELAKHFESKELAKAHAAIAETCLLRPTVAEFQALRAKASALPTAAFIAIRSISGEQCDVDIDEDAGTFAAFYTKRATDEDCEPEKVVVYRGKALGWPQYQRYVDGMAVSKLDARVTACVDAGTFPVDRDERVALFERLPYLSEIAMPAVLLLSGGGVDIEGN